MAVMLPRERWSDGRLDEFEKRIDERFDRIDERFEQVDKRFDRVEADIRELRMIMIGGFVTLLVSIIGTNVF
jgi:hypothetical protein